MSDTEQRDVTIFVNGTTIHDTAVLFMVEQGTAINISLNSDGAFIDIFKPLPRSPLPKPTVRSKLRAWLR